ARQDKTILRGGESAPRARIRCYEALTQSRSLTFLLSATLPPPLDAPHLGGGTVGAQERRPRQGADALLCGDRVRRRRRTAAPGLGVVPHEPAQVVPDILLLLRHAHDAERPHAEPRTRRLPERRPVLHEGSLAIQLHQLHRRPRERAVAQTREHLAELDRLPGRPLADLQ